MAVSNPVNKVAFQSSTGATSFSTASWTPTNNRLYICSVTTRTAANDPNTPTLSGNGITWSAVPAPSGTNYDNTGSQKRVSAFYATPSSTSAGALTADFAGQTQSDCVIIVDEFASGFDTTGTIVQSAVASDTSGTGTTLTATLGAFGSTNNATYGVCAIGNGTGTSTAGSGFTKFGEAATAANLRLVTEFRSDNSTSVGITSSVAAELGIVAMEIKASVAASSTINWPVFSRKIWGPRY